MCGVRLLGMIGVTTVVLYLHRSPSPPFKMQGVRVIVLLLVQVFMFPISVLDTVEAVPLMGERKTDDGSFKVAISTKVPADNGTNGFQTILLGQNKNLNLYVLLE